jgi:hypothetical protein
MTPASAKHIACLGARPSDGATDVGIVLIARHDVDVDPPTSESAPHSVISSGGYDP